MILVAALLLGQVPPPPSGQPIPYGGVEILDPIAAPMARYMRCIRQALDQRGGMNTSDRRRYRDAVDDSIDACADTRRTELAEADRLLSRTSDYRGPARRAAAIHQAFAGSEQQMRDMPEIMDRIRRERAGAAPEGDDMAPIDIPYQIMPAFMIYSNCVEEHFTADRRADSADPIEMRRANSDALAACRQVREEQLARALELQTDFRLYRNRADGRAAVRRAFERFGRDYQVEAVTASATPGDDAAPKDQ
jgi:hypothetical protein